MSDEQKSALRSAITLLNGQAYWFPDKSARQQELLADAATLESILVSEWTKRPNLTPQENA